MTMEEFFDEINLELFLRWVNREERRRRKTQLMQLKDFNLQQEIQCLF